MRAVLEGTTLADLVERSGGRARVPADDVAG